LLCHIRSHYFVKSFSHIWDNFINISQYEIGIKYRYTHSASSTGYYYSL